MNMAEDRDFRGQLRYQEPMSRHCSWRAGGCADVYFEPADRDDLADYLASLGASITKVSASEVATSIATCAEWS